MGSPTCATAMTWSQVSSGGRASSAILAAKRSASSPRKPKRPGFFVGAFSTGLSRRPSDSRRAKAVVGESGFGEGGAHQWLRWVESVAVLRRWSATLPKAASSSPRSASSAQVSLQRLAHAGHPGIARGGVDGEGRVHAAQPRRAALGRVALRAAQPFAEVGAQHGLRVARGRRMHRADGARVGAAVHRRDRRHRPAARPRPAPPSRCEVRVGVDGDDGQGAHGTCTEQPPYHLHTHAALTPGGARDASRADVRSAPRLCRVSNNRTGPRAAPRISAFPS